MKNLLRKKMKTRLVMAIKSISRCLSSPYQNWYLVREIGKGNYYIMSDRGYELSLGIFTFDEVELVLRFLKIDYRVMFNYNGFSIVELE